MRDTSHRAFDGLPNHVGVGFKPQHYDEILTEAGDVRWLEIHAENYMGDGGRPLAQLRHLAERFAISVHGVGLSIGGDEPLDQAHLARLKHLLDWLNPASFSEHLAWSSHGGQFLNDLLPLPYTKATLAKVGDHIDEVQQRLGRQMLLENPSTYLAFAENEMPETAFLAALCQKTGCGLLLDVNNVHVAAANQQTDAYGYLADFPLDQVGELHLGGHDPQSDEHGDALLIDSHAAPVAAPVWDIYAATLARLGPCATLIEWDNDVPAWPVLRAEAAQAEALLTQVRP